MIATTNTTEMKMVQHLHSYTIYNMIRPLEEIDGKREETRLKNACRTNLSSISGFFWIFFFGVCIASFVDLIKLILWLSH